MESHLKKSEIEIATCDRFSRWFEIGHEKV